MRLILSICALLLVSAGVDGTASLSTAAIEASALPRVYVAAGGYFTCAVKDRVTKCWGRNQVGQLGACVAGDLGDEPGEMGSFLPVVDLGTNRYAVQIAAGADHACAVLDNADLKCWGGNPEFGYLGQGDEQEHGLQYGSMGDNLPAIRLGTGRTVVQVAAGVGFTCALLDNKRVKCFGKSEFNQTGLMHQTGTSPDDMGDNLPTVPCLGDMDIQQVVAGLYHACALAVNGSVWCWGTSEAGRLGSPDGHVAVPLGTNRIAIQIDAGANHACAVLDDKTVKCWGVNSAGQLGYGDINNRGDNLLEMGDNLPAVDLGTGRTALQVISAGEGHTCVVMDNQQIKCWGDNGYGQLGVGSSDNMGDGPDEMGDNLPPVPLGAGRTAIQVSVGYDHTCAVLDTLAIKCWGGNSNGQLGLGHTQTIGYEPGQLGDSLPAVDLDIIPSPSPPLLTPTSPPPGTPQLASTKSSGGANVGIIAGAAAGGGAAAVAAVVLAVVVLMRAGLGRGAVMPAEGGKPPATPAMHVMSKPMGSMQPYNEIRASSPQFNGGRNGRLPPLPTSV